MVLHNSQVSSYDYTSEGFNYAQGAAHVMIGLSTCKGKGCRLPLWRILRLSPQGMLLLSNQRELHRCQKKREL